MKILYGHQPKINTGTNNNNTVGARRSYQFRQSADDLPFSLVHVGHAGFRSNRSNRSLEEQQKQAYLRTSILRRNPLIEPEPAHPCASFDVCAWWTLFLPFSAKSLGTNRGLRGKGLVQYKRGEWWMEGRGEGRGYYWGEGGGRRLQPFHYYLLYFVHALQMLEQHRGLDLDSLDAGARRVKNNRSRCRNPLNNT